MSDMGQPVLRANRVSELYDDCLFRKGEDASQRVVVEGIMARVGFHAVRLEGHRTEIHAMLRELPADFQEDGGQGASFLGACSDAAGRQWTSMHFTMDLLVMLGLAIGKVEYCLPREMWVGMPYFVVKH